MPRKVWCGAGGKALVVGTQRITLEIMSKRILVRVNPKSLDKLFFILKYDELVAGIGISFKMYLDIFHSVYEQIQAFLRVV